jgi:hypothetical protein
MTMCVSPIHISRSLPRKLHFCQKKFVKNFLINRIKDYDYE